MLAGTGGRAAGLAAGITLVAVGGAGYLLAEALLPAEARRAGVITAALIAGAGLTLILSDHRPSPPPGGWRSRAQDLLAVFFTFGTVGPLLMLVALPEPPPPLVGLAALVVGGTISVLWAGAYSLGRLWLIPVAAAVTVLGPELVFTALDRAGALGAHAGLSPRARLGVLLLEAVVSLVIGYVLLARYIQRVERAAALDQAELATAAAIHRQLVPTIDRRLHGLAVHGRSCPSRTMGGDLIDLIERPGGFDAVLADVTGHGVRAGVVMALVKGVIRRGLRDAAPLDEAVGRINAVLCELLEPGLFVTAAIVRFNGREAACLVAGHPPPILLRAAGTAQRLDSSGLPLGVAPEQPYRATPLTLGPGDRLVLYSDGLIESLDDAGRTIGLDGLEARLRKLTPADGQAITDALLRTIYRGPAPGAEPDDRTAVIIHAPET